MKQTSPCPTMPCQMSEALFKGNFFFFSLGVEGSPAGVLCKPADGPADDLEDVLLPGLVLGEARVELDDALERSVLVRGDVDRLGGDVECDLLGAGRGGQGPAVLVDVGVPQVLAEARKVERVGDALLARLRNGAQAVEGVADDLRGLVAAAGDLDEEADHGQLLVAVLEDEMYLPGEVLAVEVVLARGVEVELPQDVGRIV